MNEVMLQRFLTVDCKNDVFDFDWYGVDLTHVLPGIGEFHPVYI